MELTITFEEIKEGYEWDIWKKEDVREAVVKGKLTEEEYRMITGEDYVK